MIQLQLGGYNKDDIKTLIKVFTENEAGFYCMGELGNYELCRADYHKCKHYKVCRDITLALNYLYSKVK